MHLLGMKTNIPIALDEELIGIANNSKKAKLLDEINPQYIILKPIICKLVQKYGPTPDPQVMPSVGEGQIYGKIEYNLYLAAANLIILLLVLYAFLKSDIGYRIFGSSRVAQAPKHPEPMV